jgi:hypothetical protein
MDVGALLAARPWKQHTQFQERCKQRSHNFFTHPQFSLPNPPTTR